jgi:hemerythrin-like domain-containing protein
MDAIELLESQHRETEQLFERARNADGNEQRDLARELVHALRMHTTIEEEIAYPAIREALPDAEDDVLEGYEEHHAVELLIDELDGMSPADENYDAKLAVVEELVLHHVEEEEQELFPQVRRAMAEDHLQDLGERMAGRVQELEVETDDSTKEELYAKAQQLDISGRSQMSKRQLARALTRAS